MISVKLVVFVIPPPTPVTVTVKVPRFAPFAALIVTVEV